MEVISAREFRTNQTKYLGMVKEGKEVILKSRGLGSFRITPPHRTRCGDERT